MTPHSPKSAGYHARKPKSFGFEFPVLSKESGKQRIAAVSSVESPLRRVRIRLRTPPSSLRKPPVSDTTPNRAFLRGFPTTHFPDFCLCERSPILVAIFGGLSPQPKIPFPAAGAMCTSGRSGYVDQWGWTCGFDPVAQRDPNFIKARAAFVLTPLIVPLPQSLNPPTKASLFLPRRVRRGRRSIFSALPPPRTMYSG